MNKTKKIIILPIFVVMLFSFVLGFSSMGYKAFASSYEATTLVSGEFAMDDGVSLKLNNDGGLRFILRMNEDVKNYVCDENNADVKLGVIVAPKDLMLAANGDYLGMAKKVDIEIDKAKLYQVGEDWLANACIIQINEQNREYNFTAVGYIVDGTSVQYTAYNDLARGNLYNVVNQCVLGSYTKDVLELTSYNTWFGVDENYPIMIDNTKDYDTLIDKINSNDAVAELFDGKSVLVSNGATPSEGKEIVGDKKPEIKVEPTLEQIDKTATYAYDCDLSSSNAYEFTLDGTNASDIVSLALVTENGDVNVPFTVNGEKISVENALVKTIPYGDYVLKATTDTAIISYKISIVTKVLTTLKDISEFQALASANLADGVEGHYGGYYILGNDIEGVGFTKDNEKRFVTKWPYSEDKENPDPFEKGFYGIFDGRGHTISDLYILNSKNNGANTYASGLFGNVVGTVRNLCVKDPSVSIQTMDMQGIICGSNSGKISNVSVVFTKDIHYESSGTAGAMSIFGIYTFFGKPTDYGTFNNCSVLLESGVKNAKDIYFTCTPTYMKDTNGDGIKEELIREHYHTFNNCVASSSVITSVSQNGTFVTNLPEEVVLEEIDKTNVYAYDCDLSISKDYEFALEGINASDIKSLVLVAESGDVNVPFTVNGEKISVANALVKTIPYGDYVLKATTDTAIISYKIAVVTKILRTKADIYGFKALTEANYVDGVEGHYGGYYILGNDITCDGGAQGSDANHAFISTWKFENNKYGFYGIFDGRGHTIEELYIYHNTGYGYYSNTYASGLFGHVVGTVKNLCIKNPAVATTTMNMQGIVCGANSGEISNVSVVFTKDIVYRGSLPTGMDGSISAFGSYTYYGKASDYGTFNNCSVIVEEAVTNEKAIYFTCTPTKWIDTDDDTKVDTEVEREHYHTFNNCTASANVIIKESENGTSVTVK